MNSEQQEYERRELDRAIHEERQIEGAPLSERKENQQNFFKAMRDDPAVVAERLGWLFNGSYGKGAQLRALQVLASPRMNRQAALNQLTGIYEWRCPGRMIVDAWKKLSPAQKQTLQMMLEIVIIETENELRAEASEPSQPPSLPTTPSKHGFILGQSVQMHPATDAFMRGDRYGDVVGFGREKVHVKMVRSGKIRKVSPGNLNPL
jgi:hypothetical protein